MEKSGIKPAGSVLENTTAQTVNKSAKIWLKNQEDIKLFEQEHPDMLPAFKAVIDKISIFPVSESSILQLLSDAASRYYGLYDIEVKARKNTEKIDEIGQNDDKPYSEYFKTLTNKQRLNEALGYIADLIFPRGDKRVKFPSEYIDEMIKLIEESHQNTDNLYSNMPEKYKQVPGLDKQEIDALLKMVPDKEKREEISKILESIINSPRNQYNLTKDKKAAKIVVDFDEKRYNMYKNIFENKIFGQLGEYKALAKVIIERYAALKSTIYRKDLESENLISERTLEELFPSEGTSPNKSISPLFKDNPEVLKKIKEFITAHAKDRETSGQVHIVR